MNRLLSLAVILIVISAHSKAQDRLIDVPRGEFWIGLQFAIPVGTFADKIDRNLGYGGNIGVLWNPSKVSNFFQIGADLGINYMGKDKQDVGGIPMKTTNTLITTHLLARFSVQTESFFKPYVDLLGGGKFFTTTTKYDNDLLDTVLDIEDQSVFADQTEGAWSYGLGIGFTFRRKNFGADFRILYLAGGPIEYISPKNLREHPDGGYYYDQVDISNTHMVLPQVGVSLDF